MKTKKVVRKIFDTLNYSKKLKISSILPDRDSDYAILLELEDGSKFEIIIILSLIHIYRNCYFDCAVFRYQMGSEKWHQRSL